MNVPIHPTHVASLSFILREVVIPPAALAEPEAPLPLALWCASIGRPADVAALLLVQPMPLPLHDVFEAEIRQTIAAELLTRPAIADAERQHLEDVAWIAFDRRMQRHGWSRALGGDA